MTRFLLAAEADQIQDLLFRSSRLREVVGGSQLLSQFCREGAEELLTQRGGTPEQLIVNDGGAFRVWFTDAERGRDFGRDLAELYRLCTGGGLTVADNLPEYDESDPASFTRASNEVHAALRAAKNRGQQARATAAHLPYTAFCVSCGVMVANEHHARHDDDEPGSANYICRYCLHKAAAARRSEEEVETETGFLDLFRKAARTQLEKGTRLSFPRRHDWPEALAKFEPRRYVAYLKADGNGMGIWFNRCRTEAELKKLSAALSRVLREALAAPCGRLRERIDELEIRKADRDVLPVLPLILGGDDLFALLPACWALHFAAKFCQAYEEKILTALRDDVKLPEAQASTDQFKRPTIAAAVVICKANYPYTLAHERCEELLKEAKHLARRMELEQKQSASSINFAIITGNDVGGLDHSGEGDYRATLRPYFVNEPKGDQAENMGKAGMVIMQLIEHRRELCTLPGKRRAELESLYDAFELSQLQNDRSVWVRSLQTILRRLTENESKKVKSALKALGQENEEAAGYWRNISRPPQESFKGHGLPDLLAAWEFAWSLDRPRSAYLAKEQGEDA